MKTRKELEEMGLHPDWVTAMIYIRNSGRYSFTMGNAIKSTHAPDAPIFAPGHEPVSKEGRELLEYIAALSERTLTVDGYGFDRAACRNSIDARLFAYRDSLTPAVVVPDGWREVNMKYEHEHGEIWNGEPRVVHINHDGYTLTFQRDTLPEAFEAANDVMRKLGLTATEDPNPWRKTDGMAPPKEAGDRVIETVDGAGIRRLGEPAHGRHTWSAACEAFRPIKWRYADGGES